MSLWQDTLAAGLRRVGPVVLGAILALAIEGGLIERGRVCGDPYGEALPPVAGPFGSWLSNRVR